MSNSEELIKQMNKKYFDELMALSKPPTVLMDIGELVVLLMVD